LVRHGRIALLDSAKAITVKYGSGPAKHFFSQVAAAELKGLSKAEISALAEEFLKKGIPNLLDGQVFSKSNAKQLAGIFNKGIDKVDLLTKNYMIKRLARINTKEFTELLAQQMNIPGTFQVLGSTKAPFGFLSSKAPGKLVAKGRDTARWGLEAALFPMSRGQAITSGYARGLAGGLSVGAMESLLTSMPRALLQSPQYRSFFRAMISEIQLHKAYNLGGVGTAETAFNSFKMAAKAAKDIGIGSAFTKETVASNIAGRLTVPVFTTFVFVDRDERKKKVENFNRSMPAFARKRVKVYVDSYSRRDGTRVRRHTRMVAA